MQITIPTLETSRLRLIPPQLCHLDLYIRLYGDQKVMQHLCEPLDREAALKSLTMHAGQWVLSGFGGWCIEDKHTHILIGICGLKTTDDNTKAEIGWLLSPSVWGYGFATEAAQAIVSFAFAQAGIKTVVAEIAANNTASLSVAKKLGMRLPTESSILVANEYYAVLQASEFTQSQ